MINLTYGMADQISIIVEALLHASQQGENDVLETHLSKQET